MEGKIVEHKCIECGKSTYTASERAGGKCKYCGGKLVPEKTYQIDDSGRFQSARTMPNESRQYKQRESEEQILLFNWIAYARCTVPELDLLYHIPNGGSRNKLEAANLKRQGVRAGVPDLCLPVARRGYHGLYIELKAGKNKPQDSQLEWLAKLSEQGYKVAVCYGWERAKEELLTYLILNNN